MKKREFAITLVKTLIIAVFALAFLLPLIWMVTSSLKNTNEVFAGNWRWLPREWKWSNYAAVWTDPDVSMFKAYLNTSFITVIGTVVQLIISSMAAYAFAKVKFQGKQVVFVLFLATMMMPTEVTIVPRFILFKTVGLYNNLWAIILPHFFNATAIFLLRQFYIGLPDDLMEAAKIDGAGHLRIFGQILLPLTKPAIITVAVLKGVGVYNEYYSANLYLQSNSWRTISTALYSFSGPFKSSYNIICAGVLLTLIPSLIIFLVFQKQVYAGLASGSVKG